MSKMAKIKLLPLTIDVETKSVLKKVNAANKALAELKGIAQTIPNQSVLINTLSLQEAKDSSAVENIITTHDQLYQAQINEHSIKSISTKEVQNYITALKCGFDLVKKHQLLTNRHILEIQEKLENNNVGFRKMPGTELKNETTGQVIFTPPQDPKEIKKLMHNLEIFINYEDSSDMDPLVKMAIIHHQFESIHPFYDGNGRTGRIINIIYLVLNDLLEIPILYLSRYIIENKNDYYRLLQNVREKNDWEIKQLMQTLKINLRQNYKFYSQDLLNNLFKHPYTKIQFVQLDLNVTRPTATTYLETLTADGILSKTKVGKNNYYVNHELFRLLTKNR
jgi:Fic family protein